MMNVILNTISDNTIAEQLVQRLSSDSDTKLFNTNDMNIHQDGLLVLVKEDVRKDSQGMGWDSSFGLSTLLIRRLD